MRLSASRILAVIILLVAVPYLLVRLDLLDAELLRLVPAAVLVFVAVSMLLRTRGERRKERTP